MFSFFSFKTFPLREFGKIKVKGFLLLWVILILGTGAGIFTGCSMDGGNDDGVSMPNALLGTWGSKYAEEYIVTATVFTSKMSGNVGYEGKIVNVREDGNDPGAGYITIKYTYPGDYGTVNYYYVIRYENLTSSTVSFIGSKDGAGKATQKEAEDEYTKDAGYFSFGSDCIKLSGKQWTNVPIGNWTDSSNYYSISNGIISYGFGFGFWGEIVNVRDNKNGTGYITFRYVENNLGKGLTDKFCVLYCEAYVPGTSVKLSVACANNPGDIGEDTQNAAETEYTLEKGYYNGIKDFKPSF